ncbi:hypothetical protein CaCOL14_009921 [Colletotrichum acutatum]
MVQRLWSIAATSAATDHRTQVTYAVRKPGFERINIWFESLSETQTENSLVDFPIVPDDATMKGKPLLSRFPNQLIIFSAWFHCLTIVESDAERHPRVMMPWPGKLIIMRLQADQGLFSLPLVKREGNPLFMVGNSVSAWTGTDGSSTLTLMAPTCIPTHIVMKWLNSNGAQ